MSNWRVVLFTDVEMKELVSTVIKATATKVYEEKKATDFYGLLNLIDGSGRVHERVYGKGEKEVE